MMMIMMMFTAKRHLVCDMSANEHTGPLRYLADL